MEGREMMLTTVSDGQVGTGIHANYAGDVLESDAVLLFGGLGGGKFLLVDEIDRFKGAVEGIGTEGLEVFD